MSENEPWIDLCFVIDSTGSMGPYIKEAADKIDEIADKIRDEIRTNTQNSQTPDLQVAVVAYRDHDNDSFTEEFAVKRVSEFTSDIDEVKRKLRKLKAAEGGDGPEAVGTALDEALKLKWRKHPLLCKIVILVTDAPPHGIGEDNDMYPDNDPHSIYDIPGRLADDDIRIFVLMCFPEMRKKYKFAENFYKTTMINIPPQKKTKSRKTLLNGAAVALTNAGFLADAIIGFALDGYRLEDAVSKLPKTSPSRVKIASPKLQHYLYFIATGENEGIEQHARTEDEAIQQVKNLLAGTEFPSIKSSMYAKSLTSEEKHNAAIWERVASGEELDLEAKLKPYARGSVDKNQTLDYEYGPINDHQILRLAWMYANSLGDEGNNEEGEDEEGEGEGEGEGDEDEDEDEDEANENDDEDANEDDEEGGDEEDEEGTDDDEDED